MGWGTIPDDHPLIAGMVGLQTSHRYGNATMLESDFVLGIGNRWANRHTGGIDTYTEGRKFVHVDIEPTQIGRVFAPDYGIVSDAGAALELFVEVAREWREAGRAARPYGVGGGVPASASARCCARRDFDNVAGQAAAGLPGDEQGVRTGHPLRLARSACRRSRRRRCCTSTSRGTGSTPARRARSAGPCPAALGVATADPERDRRGAVRRLRLPVPDRGAGGRRAVQHPLHPRAGEQRLPRPDPAGAARVRHGLLRPAGVRQHQQPRARRLRRRPRQGRRGPGLQGDPGVRARRHPARARAGQEARWSSTGCRSSSR